MNEKKVQKKISRKATIIDGMSIYEMTKDQLENHVYRLQKEIEKEREERNYFQEECDRIISFWEISKTQLEEKKAEVLLKEKELEECEQLHLSEIQVYKQKMKYIMLECENHINKRIQDEITTTTTAEEEFRKKESLLMKEKEDLADELSQLKKEHDSILSNIKMRHDEEIALVQADFENKISVLQKEHAMQINHIKEKLHHQRKQDITEIKDSYKLCAENLVANQKKTLKCMKEYFENTNQNNLQLIESMKEEIKMLKQKEKMAVKKVRNFSREAQTLSDNLHEAQTELLASKAKLKHYNQKEINYMHIKSKIKYLNEKIKQVTWENDSLKQQLEKAEKERNDLNLKLQEVNHSVNKRLNLKLLILEKQFPDSKPDFQDKSNSSLHAMCGLQTM